MTLRLAYRLRLARWRTLSAAPVAPRVPLTGASATGAASSPPPHTSAPTDVPNARHEASAGSPLADVLTAAVTVGAVLHTAWTIVRFWSET